MPNTHETLTSLFSDIADAIREKTGDSAEIIADEFPDAIEAIPSGGSPDIDSGVKFMDYDGTIVEMWDASSVAGKTALPDNPSHDGLVAQGWNWSLANIKSYVAKYPTAIVWVGQMYATASGYTEMDIEINKATGLEFSLWLEGTRDWGDGASGTETTHTYADYGRYTITFYGTELGGTLPTNCTSLRIGKNVALLDEYLLSYTYVESFIIPNDGALNTLTSFTGFNQGLLYLTIPQSIEEINYSFTASAIGGMSLPDTITSVVSSFKDCNGLSSITIPESATEVKGSFTTCNMLSSVLIPSGVLSCDENSFEECKALQRVDVYSDGLDGSFAGCSSLRDINIHEGVIAIGESVFAEGGFVVSRVVFPSTISTIGSNFCESSMSLKRLDFSASTEVPIVGSSFLTSQHELLKIIVPDALYDEWIAADNWSTYADYIYKASEVE